MGMNQLCSKTYWLLLSKSPGSSRDRSYSEPERLTTGLAHSTQLVARTIPPVDVPVETVVNAVLADSPHAVIVAHTSVVKACTVGVPDIKEVESVTVSVHRGIAELTPHDDAVELAVLSCVVVSCVADGWVAEGELDGLSSSFSGPLLCR